MKRKIALLADIHGNLTALDAVLADCQKEAVTDYWFLGDLFFPGPASQEILDRLAEVNTSVYLKGNWEDCLLTVLDKNIDVKDASDVYIGILAKKLLNYLEPDSSQFIRELPMQVTQQINTLKIGLTHNLPDKNWGGALITGADQKEFDALFTEDFDIAIYAHVHHQQLRYSQAGQIIINPGSIGEPFSKREKLRLDMRAHYAILEMDERGLADVNFKRISYDIRQELTRAKDISMPFYELYEELLTQGTLHTHDKETLEVFIQKNNYREELKSFLASL